MYFAEEYGIVEDNVVLIHTSCFANLDAAMVYARSLIKHHSLYKRVVIYHSSDVNKPVYEWAKGYSNPMPLVH